MSQHTPDSYIEHHWLDEPPGQPPGQQDRDEIFCEQCCKCGEACNPSESVHNETDDEWICVNCIEEQKQPKPLSPFGTSIEDVLKIVEPFNRIIRKQMEQ